MIDDVYDLGSVDSNKESITKKANELCLMTSFEWNNYR